MSRSCLALAALLVLLVAPRAALGQPAADTTAARWQLDLNSRLNTSQAAYVNWAKGGLNTFAVTTSLGGAAKRTSSRWDQTHELRLSFGLVKQDTLQVRKADDQIQLTTAVRYSGDGFMHQFGPSFNASVATQFAKGFNYKKNPFEDGREPPVEVSAFFSPATFNQSLGFTYKPVAWFSSQLGVGAQETVVVIERFRPLYGVPHSRAVLVQIGVESQTRLDKEVFENVLVQSRLVLFSAFTEGAHPDVRWENDVQMKVNSWLHVNLEWDTLYDQDLASDIQMKEMLSFGVSVALI